jgi:tetratricopeptide (TPR) repeat protein
VYVNNLGAEGLERVYGPHYARLAALKRTYDPANVFRLNQNVPGVNPRTRTPAIPPSTAPDGPPLTTSNTTAVRLQWTGEGLAASIGAIELRRELVKLNRHAYLPELAMSVSNLAIRLDEANRHADALAATREAVDLYRAAVALDREAHLPGLAAAMQDLALRLDVTGSPADALAAARGSVDLYREVVDFDDREAHLAELATSTSTLAAYVHDAGQHAKALAATEDVVDLCRELVELDHYASLPDLAGSVLNLATLLAQAERLADAVTLGRGAFDHYRELARTRSREVRRRC